MIKANTLKRNTSSTSSGAVDENYFNRAFNEIIDVHIFCARDVESYLLKTRECIGDPNIVWNKHIEALRMIRGLVAAGAANYEEFFIQLRLLETSFESILRDLRSQVIKEACVTVAYLAKKLENKIDIFAECILPHLIVLLLSSKKVISSSAIVCLRILLQHTRSVKIIPIIIKNLSSKSKEIRRAMCEFIALILHTWERNILDKHAASLKQAIKKGIADADTEVRSYSRKAYWAFYEHYEQQANTLMQQLDLPVQRTLQLEKRGIQDHSSSIAWEDSIRFSAYQPHHRGISGSATKPQKDPVTSSSLSSGDTRSKTPPLEPEIHPTSNMDTNSHCVKFGSGVSLPCLGKVVPGKASRSTSAGQNRISRCRSRLSAVTLVRPRDRSGSVPPRHSRELYPPSDFQFLDIYNQSSLKESKSRKSGNDTGTSRLTRDSREISPNKYTDRHTELQYDNCEANEQSSLKNVGSSQSYRSKTNFSPFTEGLLTVLDRNGFDTFYHYNQTQELDILGLTTSGKMIESEAIRKIIEQFDSPVKRNDSNNFNCPISDEEKKISLSQLEKLIGEIHCSAVIYHFKSILRLLLSQLSCNDNESSIKLLALSSLNELIKRSDLVDSFNSFVELVVLKVLQSIKDVSKEVKKSAEMCAATAASMLNPDLLIGVLAPLIIIEDYHVNLGAIKTLTIVVETRSQDHVQSYLSDLMPALIKAYDHKEGSVRKSALFCLVALYIRIGEEQLRSHLINLDEGKQKLLHLYVDRAQQRSSFSNHQTTHALSSWTSGKG